MNMIAIVICSVFGGMLLLAAIAGIIFLNWQAWDLRKSLRNAEKDTEAIHQGTRQALVAFAEEVKAQLERNDRETKAAFDSAKGSFSTIRAETSKTLEDHRRELAEQLAKINAEALSRAIQRVVEISLRLEKAFTLFQRQIFENMERTANEYGPEETAPEGSSSFAGPPSFYSTSLAAREDEQSIQEEANLVTSAEPGAV